MRRCVGKSDWCDACICLEFLNVGKESYKKYGVINYGTLCYIIRMVECSYCMSEWHRWYFIEIVIGYRYGGSEMEVGAIGCRKHVPLLLIYLGVVAVGLVNSVVHVQK